MNSTEPTYRMPAEWEPHTATWLGWPHLESDWPGKLEPIRWFYTEFARVLAASERVEIVCHDETYRQQAADCLERAGVTSGYRLHVLPTDRTWLRDSGPTCVRTPEGAVALIDWKFNAWAKYDNHQYDDRIPQLVAQVTGLTRIEAQRPDGGGRMVLEGGSIDTDGAGTLLTTEECLLSEVQHRNPGMSRADYEEAFGDYLGIRRTIWLGNGCAGDDTHGHVDDIARFVAPAVVLLAFEPDPRDENHASSVDNLKRLAAARDAEGRALRIIKLPYPRAVTFEGQRLPASYANFYIANDVVLVPTFNDPNDRVALNILAELFPARRIVGIHCVDTVLGQGTLHCLSQQQPA